MMDEQRLKDAENSIGLIDCPDCEQGRVSREGTFEDGQEYERCETCDGSGMVSRFPDGHALIAEVRRLQQQQKAVQETWIDEVTQARQERDAAIAERDAAEAKIAGANMVARQMMDRLDGTQAALTEARRVLREASEWLEPEISRGPANPQWVRMMREIAAVLAQEEA